MLGNFQNNFHNCITLLYYLIFKSQRAPKHKMEKDYTTIINPGVFPVEKIYLQHKALFWTPWEIFNLGNHV